MADGEGQREYYRVQRNWGMRTGFFRQKQMVQKNWHKGCDCGERWHWKRKGQVLKSLAWVLRKYILYTSDGCFSDISSVKGKRFSQILSWFQYSLNIMAETVYNSLIFILPIFLLVDRIPQILPGAYIFQPPLQLSMVTWPRSGQWEVSGEEGLQLLCPVLIRKLLALYFLSTPSHRLEIQRSGDKPAPTTRMKAILLDLADHTWSVWPAAAANSPGSLWKCRISARITPTEVASAVK